MAKNKITLNELRSLVKKVVNEEIHNESFWEKNLIINVKGLSVLDAIKKIKSQISPMKVLFEKKIEEKNCIILPTDSNRDDLFTQDSITEGYIFYYKKNELTTDVPSNNLTGLKKAEQDYLNDWQGVAITDAKFSTELKLDESKIKATLHELRSIVRQVINENVDVEERVNRISDYISKDPKEKDRMLSDLENIKNGLNDKGEWVGEKGTEYHQLWGYHYKGFTSKDIANLIAGVNAKLGTGEEMNTEVNKIIEIAKAFLQKYPNSKDFLLQSVISALYKA